MKNCSKMLIGGLLLTLTCSLFAELPIRSSTNKDSEAAIAYNSANDEYLVVWTEWKPSGSTTLPVMGQRVKGDGTGLIGGPFTIFPLGVYPSVAYNSQANEYLVTAAAFGTIEGQRVSNTGTLAGGWLGLMSKNSAIWPKIVYNTLGNNYLLVGAELINVGNDLSTIKIFTRKIAANGQPTGTEQHILELAHGNYNDGARFSVAYAPVTSTETPTGRYLLAIEEPGAINMLDDNGAIVSKVVDHSGTIVGTFIPFQNSKVGEPFNVDVAFGDWEGSPSFMVVWGDRNNKFNEKEWTGVWGGIVSATEISFTTQSAGSNEIFPISKIAFHWPLKAKEWKPVVAYNKIAKKFMVSWRETPSQDPLNDTKVNHIRANAIESSMLQPEPPDNVVLSAISGNEDPKNPAIAASTKNANALVVWEDARNFATTDIDLYGSLFNTTPAKTLKLTAPNGGEVWQAGIQHEIKWTSANLNAPVKLWISYNGYNPQFWAAVDLMQSTPNDGSYLWTVPNIPSTNCVIKVADAADGAPWDESDAPFTITAQAQSLTVTSPNGGEKWQVGSNHNITWTSQNLSNPVKIEYSTNGGSSYSTIVSSTSNDGSHNWTIPNQPSVNCLVRISDATDGAPSDVSNAVFTISTPGNTGTGSNVEVDVGNGVKVKFDNVTRTGETKLDVKTGGPPPPSGFKIMPSGLPVYFDINTTASFTGNITICIPYNDAGLTPGEEAKLRLHVYESPPGKWKDITKPPVDVNANIICGTVTHLTVFAMMLGPTHFTFKSPTQESYSIVLDNATLDGTQLANGDEIGVFTPAGLCVGASVWDGTTPLALTAWADDSQTPGVVDGYKSGEKMFFRIWDASAGTNDDYAATPTYSGGNGNFGDGAFARISSLAAATSVTQALALQQGWSWISFNVEPQDQSMESVMAGVTNLVIVVNGAGQFYIPNVINNIGQMNVLEGYKIFVSAPGQVSVTGKPVAATSPIALKAGWNFVSYLPSTAMSAETALASVLSQLAIIKNDDGKFFIPNLVNSLGNMTPGEGYKLFLNADATLTYPQGSTLAKVRTNRITTHSASAKHFAFRQRTGESFSVVVKSNGQGFKPGDEIGLFTPAGLCVGAGVWDGSDILGISAWADDDRTDIIDGFRQGEMMQFKFWDADKNRVATLNAIFTTGSDRFDDGAFAVVELESPGLPTTFSLRQNYPNPFNAGTVISYQLPESGKVTLKVYNLLGEQVRMLLNEAQDAGAYSVHWDAKDYLGRFVPSGVYLYRIQTGSYSAVRKAVFVK